MDAIHPIRIWKIEKKLKETLASFRGIYRRSILKYVEPKNGVMYFEAPIGADPRQADSFESLQGLLFKENESKTFLHQFLQFWDGNRQVFAMAPELSEQLSQTEIGDVPWSELLLPHSEFYISFGDYGQEPFELRGFYYIIDGAYVKHVDKASHNFPNDTLLLQFTCRLIHPSYGEAKDACMVRNFHYAEPIYQFCVSGKGCTTIGDAMARGELDYRAYCAQIDRKNYVLAQQLAANVKMPFGRQMDFAAQKFERGRSQILPALPILFNSIFYLSQRPESRNPEYPQTAPSELVQDWKKTISPQVKKSLETSLEKKGFSKIVFVREPDLEVRTSNNESTREVRSHWRRGHWRNQSFGAGNSLKRWIWIKPILVRRGEPFELGAIHQVRPQ